MERLYLALGLLAVIGLGWWRYDYVASDRDALKVQNKSLSDAIKNRDDIISAERKWKIDAEKSRDDYLKKIEETSNEIENLKSRVNSGSTILRIAANCPSKQNGTVAANTVGITAASPELTEDARQDYYAHIADEEKLGGLLDMCVRQLKIDRGLQP